MALVASEFACPETVQRSLVFFKQSVCKPTSCLKHSCIQAKVLLEALEFVGLLNCPASAPEPKFCWSQPNHSRHSQTKTKTFRRLYLNPTQVYFLNFSQERFVTNYVVGGWVLVVGVCNLV